LSEVDVLDARAVAQLGAPESVGELSGVSFGDLSVDEEPEAFLERQVVDLGARRAVRPVSALGMAAHRSSWSFSMVG